MTAFSKTALLLKLLFCLPVFYVTAQPSLSASALKQLDNIATQDVPAKAPGIATAIIQEGTVIFEKYAGIADFADSSLIGPTTRFNIASNGKQFTALTILSLIDEQKIHPKDDIRKYFPSLFSHINSPITIDHLLTHTSGIRDVYDLWSLQGLTWWKESFSNQDVLKLVLQQQQLNFSPGSQYLYSNTNYILLALLIEKVTGRSFTDVTNTLFKKMNMLHTSFEADYTKIKGQIARAYFNFNTWTTYTWIWNVCGDGNLFSTLNDQIQWERIVQGNIKTDIKKELITKSQRLTDTTLNTQYGYGLEFSKYKGMPYLFHEGATGAWKATVIRFPERSLSLITLTNTGKSIPSMQTRQMVDVLLDLKTTQQLLITQPATVGKYVSEDEITGTYLTDNNFSFQFERTNGLLYLKRNGRNDIVLEREAANVFHQKNDPAFKQEFLLNEKGEMQVTAYYTTHAPYSLTRPTVQWTGFDPSSLNGKYLNEETTTTIEIKFMQGQEYEVKIGKSNTYKAILVTPTKLLAGNYVIQMNAENTAAIYLDGERIRKVMFKRL